MHSILSQKFPIYCNTLKIAVLTKYLCQRSSNHCNTLISIVTQLYSQCIVLFLGQEGHSVWLPTNIELKCIWRVMATVLWLPSQPMLLQGYALKKKYKCRLHFDWVPTHHIFRTCAKLNKLSKTQKTSFYFLSRPKLKLKIDIRLLGLFTHRLQNCAIKTRRENKFKTFYRRGQIW